jgi:hypothetical protein
MIPEVTLNKTWQTGKIFLSSILGLDFVEATQQWPRVKHSGNIVGVKTPTISTTLFSPMCNRRLHNKRPLESDVPRLNVPNPVRKAPPWCGSPQELFDPSRGAYDAFASKKLLSKPTREQAAATVGLMTSRDLSGSRHIGLGPARDHGIASTDLHPTVGHRQPSLLD